MRLPRIVLFVVKPRLNSTAGGGTSPLAKRFLRQARVSPWLFLVLAAAVAVASAWWLTTGTTPGSNALTEKSSTSALWPLLPGTSGPMTLVLWDYVIPFEGSPETYQLIVAEAIRQFESTHPGVKVKFELFHWSEGDQKLSEALAANGSVPIPDVYFASGDVVVYDAARQVPIERYLAREKAEYENVSLAAWTRDGHIWGWPRWLSLRTWATNLALSSSASQARERWTQSGWTWADLRTAAAEATKLGKEGEVAGIALPRSAAMATALADLAAAAGCDGPWDSSGRYTWSGPEFLRVVEFLSQLRKEKLGRMDGDRFGESAFQLFWDGRAAFVPAGGAWLHDRHERGAKIPAPRIPATPELSAPPPAPVPATSVGTDIRLALLPVPHPDGSGHSLIPTRTSAYVVFAAGTADPAKPDRRRIRAAMDLARLLSRYRIHWLAYNLRLWPAHRADLESLGPRAQTLAALLPLATPGKALTAVERQRDRQFLEDVVTPGLSRLWRKDLTAAEFTAKLAAEAAKMQPATP